MSSGVPPAPAVPLVPTSQSGFSSSNYKRIGFAGVQLVCPVICPAVGTLALSWLVQKLAFEGRLGVAPGVWYSRDVCTEPLGISSAHRFPRSFTGY